MGRRAGGQRSDPTGHRGFWDEADFSTEFFEGEQGEVYNYDTEHQYRDAERRREQVN